MTQTEGFSEEPNPENELIEAAEGEQVASAVNEPLPTSPGKGDGHPGLVG